MLPLLDAGRRIINIDESWLNETTFYRKLWRPKSEDNSVPVQAVTPRISVIAAIDTDGHLWFALTQSNTDSNVMLTFLRFLVQKLDDDVPGWRADTIFLLDGARYHTSPEMKHYMRQLGLQIAITAPASFSSSPIERLFSALKIGQLNPNHEPTGKR